MTPFPIERRAFGRRLTYQHAMAHMFGRAPLRCVVRDISEGGALLDFGCVVLLPSRLRVVWDGTGQQAECEVRNIRGEKAGVQFICPNGPRIARESIAAGAGLLDDGSIPPLAPQPARDPLVDAANDIVEKFRKSLQASKSQLSGCPPQPLAARVYGPVGFF